MERVVQGITNAYLNSFIDNYSHKHSSRITQYSPNIHRVELFTQTFIE